MKKLKFILGSIVVASSLSACSSAYFASASYASDDLYAVHDRTQIALRKQAEAEAQRAEAEARKAQWEAMLAEAEAAAAENSYYEYKANPYDAVLADDYESAYARRLRGFESPSYKLPSSYLNARYSTTFNYVSAYDPAFYNIVISGDEIWVEPKYITSMFGTWGGTVICADPWYYGWSYPWSYGLSFGSWGWSLGWSSWYNPWYYDPWGPWYSSWYRPWWGWNWGWGYGPGWGPGWHGWHGWHGHPHWGGVPGYVRPRYGSIVRRPDPYTSPSGTRYGIGSSRYGNAPSSTSPSRGNSSNRNYFGIRGSNSSSGSVGNSSRSYRDNNSSIWNNRNNSGSNSYNRGNSGSSFNRGSSSSFGGSGGGSGTRPSGGSSRNAGGR